MHATHICVVCATQKCGWFCDVHSVIENMVWREFKDGSSARYARRSSSEDAMRFSTRERGVIIAHNNRKSEIEIERVSARRYCLPSECKRTAQASYYCEVCVCVFMLRTHDHVWWSFALLLLSSSSSLSSTSSMPRSIRLHVCCYCRLCVTFQIWLGNRWDNLIIRKEEELW